MRTETIVLLKGDGIGPEIVTEAQKVLQLVSDARKEANGFQLEFKEELIGGIAIDQTGSPLPEKTLNSCLNASAVLLGAVGGPQWPRPATPENPNPPRPEQGLLDIRKKMNLFCNIRPCIFPCESLKQKSPLKEEIVKDTEFIVVRELTGGAYFGKREEENAEGVAYDTTVYSVPEVQRITRIAAKLALAHEPPYPIISIDKANVLASSRLWRRVVTETIEKEFPTVKLQHQLVDSAAMIMVKNPSALNGVLLTENMFGDILSDESSVIPGSLGLLPSASLNGWGKESNGLYEPIHGSAPEIAGQNIANPIGTILSGAMLLRYSLGLEREAKAIEKAVAKVLDDEQHGGLNIRTKELGGNATTTEIGDAICKALADELNQLNIEDYADKVEVDNEGRLVLSSLKFKRRPMTLCEKIICNSAIGLPAPYDVKPGDMVCVKVDWTIASELTWKGMEKTYDAMGRPGVNRNDRFWLAIDHTCDPSINDQPKPQALIAASRQIQKEVGIKDLHGPNETILHTDFYRYRALPGQMICGADSHSCSAGALGNFAVGLGAADVLMPLVTGETWFKVPETCEIRFVGKPKFGITGKDIIIHVLGELKRNTVGFERACEWTGPGLKYLSCDDRFAIANMSTEFGGIAGVFQADEITANFVAKRSGDNANYKDGALYFRADEGAQYSSSHIIDLSKVESSVCIYPAPDNVSPVGEVLGKELDGCFIGACTTAEEELILAGLVLEAGLKKGYVPVCKGKRKVTPGSASILARLRELGLIDVYEKAGFEVGAPGCSYCLGIAADRAGEGEVWLSSQNRNFKNRMGKGSIGNVTSASCVAASSFDMKVTDPTELLESIDRNKWEQFRQFNVVKGEDIVISEPRPIIAKAGSNSNVDKVESKNVIINGKIQRFEDHIDTDAIIPAEFMPGTSDEDLGTHCFQYVRPEFRQKVKEGSTVVVAGVGFGSGSSREEAPRALKGSGVQCVIAKSYAFIYGRNQYNMALYGIIINDDAFYEIATEDKEIHIDIANRIVKIDGKTFPFQLSSMEEKLIEGGGVTDLYSKYKNELFRVTIKHALEADQERACKKACLENDNLNW
ncbi:3-isopropylmalate dehydrogenase [Piromyces finnis]|uniref:3-isopropylmalate dehydrogenase n=1 Tax=Piromyces finnis TaxID=1754191 RepID=A0A1Y1VIN5_9FUNG|nr:3-isopropylmalate dehydrogenase [Piromyces finnis]|eukprot:ORX56507.1 3-isopropylmalate dehydrogenase [Piromyces finnis]